MTTTQKPKVADRSWRSELGRSGCLITIISVFALLGLLLVLALTQQWIDVSPYLPFLASDSKQSELYTRLVTQQKPYSTFVPLRDIVRIKTGEAVTLKTRHVSLEDLDNMEIMVDEMTFNYLFSTTKKISLFVSNKIKIYVAVDAPHHDTSSVEPKYPTNDEWIVTLGWVSEVPGTYDLRLTTTDGLGRQGDPIIQRIEVQEATP